ncbi:hypothetical protein U9M48_007359 [Paspalum notatum var. saurae]|uniref:Uncharacterized protein n=1 Tax=Paspalum notatum var. saurae TaxID=547442 RepID=A0AAQ3PV81_PASNO
MLQGDYIERHQKRHGRRPDYEERKREARELIGAKDKWFAKKRYAEKAQMKKTLKLHDESTKRHKVEDVQEGALPPYLLDREQTQCAKVIASSLLSSYNHFYFKEYTIYLTIMFHGMQILSNTDKAKEEGKGWKVGCSLAEAKQCKRMVTKATFVGPGLTRKPPKYERFIRPTGLRFTKPHVNVSELGLVTPAGKLVWGKYAQVTNNPENDGCTTMQSY